MDEPFDDLRSALAGIHGLLIGASAAVLRLRGSRGFDGPLDPTDPRQLCRCIEATQDLDVITADDSRLPSQVALAGRSFRVDRIPLRGSARPPPPFDLPVPDRVASAVRSNLLVAMPGELFVYKILAACSRRDRRDLADLIALALHVAYEGSELERAAAFFQQVAGGEGSVMVERCRARLAHASNREVFVSVVRVHHRWDQEDETIAAQIVETGEDAVERVLASLGIGR